VYLAAGMNDLIIALRTEGGSQRFVAVNEVLNRFAHVGHVQSPADDLDNRLVVSARGVIPHLRFEPEVSLRFGERDAEALLRGNTAVAVAGFRQSGRAAVLLPGAAGAGGAARRWQQVASAHLFDRGFNGGDDKVDVLLRMGR